jgi:6,7-dimethyl-8-ribityllumazine synthase
MLIGIVTARFNSEITFELEKGAIAALREAGLTDQNIWTIRVPGAVEIPLATKALLEQGCDAVVTLGAVIRGETAHFDYVCQSVERGVTQLILETGKPIGFGVLTTENEDQAFARTIGHHGNKGIEAAQTVLEMLQLLKDIKAKKNTQVHSKVKKPVKSSAIKREVQSSSTRVSAKGQRSTKAKKAKARK